MARNELKVPSLNLAALAQRQAGHLEPMQALLGLAMRAQNQSRATVETLAEVKFPKSATFIRQTNIAEQQQVNNGVLPLGRAPDADSANRLLEDTPHEAIRLDTGTPGTGRRRNPPVATVATLNRAKDADGQGSGGS